MRRRRADGYHDIETLFAFLDVGDTLTAEPADRYALVERGEFAGSAGPADANLVTRAARLAHGDALPALRFTLEKCLPVAAGLGGGSADAAAALRIMGASDRHDLAAALGADVPACLASVPAIGTGTGTALAPVENDVAGLGCLLVNPRMPLATGPVFAAWDGLDRGPIATGGARAIMQAGRNDLEAPAMRACPPIADVLAVLAATSASLVRMSGSGATCFALYPDRAAAAAAGGAVAAARPGWWTLAGALR